MFQIFESHFSSRFEDYINKSFNKTASLMAYSCQANAVLAEVSSNFFCHHSLSLRLRLLLYRILFIYHSLTPSATFSLYDPLSLHVTLNLTPSTSGKLRRGSRCLPVREAPGHRLPGLTTLDTKLSSPTSPCSSSTTCSTSSPPPTCSASQPPPISNLDLPRLPFSLRRPSSRNCTP